MAKRRDRTKPELVKAIGLKREHGWLYFVDPAGDISRVRARWAGPRRREKVARLGLEKAEGYLYYLGPSGDVYRRPMRRKQER